MNKKSPFTELKKRKLEKCTLNKNKVDELPSGIAFSNKIFVLIETGLCTPEHVRHFILYFIGLYKINYFFVTTTR